MKYRIVSIIVLIISIFVLPSCGGGGGGNGGSSSGLPSGSVPYLLGPVQVTWEANMNVGTGYDVTVTLQADGPSGVMVVSLWITEDGGGGDFRALDLVNTGGNTWQASTNTFLPLASGNYYIDDIMLEDEDVFATPPVIVGSGWYIFDPALSSTRYFIDERIIDYADLTPPWLHYEAGVGDINITTFTLP